MKQTMTLDSRSSKQPICISAHVQQLPSLTPGPKSTALPAQLEVRGHNLPSNLTSDLRENDEATLKTQGQLLSPLRLLFSSNVNS